MSPGLFRATMSRAMSRSPVAVPVGTNCKRRLTGFPVTGSAFWPESH
jgi:hypothetical protein